MADTEPTIASLAASAESGDRVAGEALFAALYSELHRLAKRELDRRGAPISLGVTTLLHEAYVDMSSRDGVTFPDRPRFMGYAARVMRGLIIEHARNRRAQKRGGQFEITSLRTDIVENLVDARELSSIGDALDELGAIDAALAQIVDLKFFCGFSFVETGSIPSSESTTVRTAKARTTPRSANGGGRSACCSRKG